MCTVFSFPFSVDKLLAPCWDCTAKHPNYAFQLEKNLDQLRKDWDELKRRSNDIKRRIEVEERVPRMRHLEEVDGWLLRVEAMEAEVEKVIKDGSQESLNKCLGGCCPKKCKTSYKLGKKVAKLQPEVTGLLSKGTFDVVTDQVSIPPSDERPTEQTLGLVSTFDEVWSCIEDDKVGIMGLYGMGGVGKTTLLIEVNNKLCNSTQAFDVVIWIVVSNNPTLTKVQDDIGEKIGFYGEEWQNRSQENKAMDIFRVLKEKKYILLLDDIWKRLDLIKFGVPYPNQNNKSKIIFTTRSVEVCGHMEAHKEIRVKCLAEEEAFDLFQKKVGQHTLNAHPEIPELANVLAKECDGLPLALITIGRAMARKTTPQEWRHAIELLKGYASEFSGMRDEIFPPLKFSYDSLPNAAIRSSFLYCSLYPEDDEISKEELIDQWIFEGFLDKFDDFHKTRDEGYNYIGILVQASLLEECSPQRIKMHDVIRDMAIWIGCDCGTMKDKFFVQARVGLTETPSVAKWQGAERVSLMGNKIEKLVGTPQCPNLLTLFLIHNHHQIIASGFLQSMPKLRILDLSNNIELTRIPTEICELVSLQYLNLSHTDLEELPMKFQNLIKLKYLNLGSTRSLKISEGVLSSFKELQMLKLDGCGVLNPLWDGLPKTFVKELESLDYLKELTITITSDFALSSFSHSRKLMSITTMLDLLHFNGSRHLDLLFLKEMISLEKLGIAEMNSLENIIIGKGKATSRIINQYCFSSLRWLWIFSCRMLKDLTWLAFAPNLEVIEIIDCPAMKTLVGGSEWDEDTEEGVKPIPFAKLKDLHLACLPQLESIYPLNLSCPCSNRKMVFSGCPKLKKLPFNSSSCRSGRGITTIYGEEEWWNGLEWKDEDTRLAFLPSFKSLGGKS